MALTATANRKVQADIMGRLGIEGCKTFYSSFNRPNLSYSVRPKLSGYKDIMAEWIRTEHDGHSGIVYCSSRQMCESLAEWLRDKFFTAEHFHAGIPVSEKDRILRDWQAGKIKIIVATVRRYILHLQRLADRCSVDCFRDGHR